MKSQECLNENKPAKIRLVVIGAPTATGKTALSIDLAESFGGHIVNADSMQVYRYMDIGTAKPNRDEQKRVVHHLIDVVDPDQDFNAALYADQARGVISGLAREGRPVFVVGGTGLYIRALLQGMIDTPPVDESIRHAYKELRDRLGREYLYGLLVQRDPRAAARLNPNDSVRVIRALEVLEQSGRSIVDLQKEHAFADCPYETCKVALRIERDTLKKRIAARTSHMLEAGLIDEVRRLLERGYGENLKSMKSLGYKQIVDYLRGRHSRERAVELISRETWLYSKRQSTWFSADQDVCWFAPEQIGDIRKTVGTFLSGKPV